MNGNQTTKRSLEDMYDELFTPNIDVFEHDDGSLVQPSPLKVVESYTTSNSYENEEVLTDKD